ncbi:hypothetical protein K438DRAFT_1784017 [Mycena galopus ATCC 62051]|nr:hypothetical protein K438DRAFT_1784017 [Mycena galopus ATCC 62051]
MPKSRMRFMRLLHNLSNDVYIIHWFCLELTSSNSVESGALYSLFAILGAVTSQFEQSANGDVVHNVISAASAQGMNILPMLILVRAGMGHNIQDRIESSRAPRRTPARSRAVEWEDSSYEVLDIKPSNSFVEGRKYQGQFFASCSTLLHKSLSLIPAVLFTPRIFRLDQDQIQIREAEICENA